MDSKEDMMKLTIGNNIRTLRRKADMTQEELAAQIGVSCQSVSRWEQGTTYPDMELLPVLAGLFGVTVDTLLGMPDIEKERKADEAFDALRRESMKAEIDPAAVIPLIREIRNNFIDCDGVWRLWTEGNYRCYRHPEILPEVRLLAEAYKKRHSNDIHLVETMAYVEDEAHIDEFFEKYTLPYDASERTLAFDRYYQLRNRERFEEERRYRFYQTISVLLTPNTLLDREAEPAQKESANAFRAGLLRLICGGAGDRVDMWISDRLEIGLENARRLANAGNGAAALEQIESFVALLEQTMAITDEQTLGSSCEWMEGMLWKAREFWKNKYNDPDGAEERSIYVYTKMPRMTTCYLIFPSTFYEILTGDAAFGGLREEPSFSLLTERVRALVETRARQGNGMKKM